MIQAVVDHFTPWLFNSGKPVVAALEVVTLFAIGIAAFRARHELRRLSAFNAVHLSWCVAFAVLAPVYLVLFWASHFYGRYTSPLLLIAIPALAGLAACLVAVRQLPVRGHAFAAAMMIGFFAVFAFASHHAGRIGNTHVITAGFVQQHFTAQEKVGAFQSGVIGFFNSNVVNLDGKLNRTALLHLEAGTLDQYIESAGLTAIIDWPSNIERYIAPRYFADTWKEFVVQPNNRSICYVRSEPRSQLTQRDLLRSTPSVER
jgi:hypothetical protein